MSLSADQMSTPRRSSSGLRYARYVGRVGALAVSLGVGFAVATTPGVAYADDSTDSTTNTSPSPNSPATSDESVSVSTSSTAVAPSSTQGAGQSRRSERNRTLRVFGASPRHLTRSARNDHSTTPPRNSDEATNDSVSETVDETDNGVVAEENTGGAGNDNATAGGSALPARDVDRTTSRRAAKDIVQQSVSPRRIQSAQPVRRSGVHVAAPTVRSTVDNSVSNASVDSPSTTASSATVTSQSPSIRTAASSAGLAAITSTPAVTPVPVTRVVQPISVVSGFLAAVGLAPSLTSPATPSPAPVSFVWTVLAFVRREIEQAQRTYLNRTPHAIDDRVTTAEQTSLTFDPRRNDRDDDTLTITGVNTTGTHGTVATDGTTITYTPNADTNALGAGETITDTFTYTVSDANSPAHLHGLFGLFSRGHSDTATVTVTITGVNDAPTVVDDSYTVASTTALTRRVLDNDSDVDGDALTATLVTANDADKGTLVFNPDGTFTYTPKADFSGTDSFTYEASDGTLTTAGTVTITVNAPPEVTVTVGTADPATGQFTVTVSYSDSAADNVTVTGSTPGDFQQVAAYVVDGSDGITQTSSASTLYAPSPEARLAAFNGTGPTFETWTFTISDGVSTVTRTVDVPISPSSTQVSGISVGSPDSTNGAVSIDIRYRQDASAVSPTVTTSDVLHGELAATEQTSTSDGVITRGTYTYTYTPTPQARTDAYNGGPTSETVTFTVDGQSFTVTVPIDPAPAVVTATIGGTGTDGEPILNNPVDVDVSIDGDHGVITDADGGLTIIDRDEDGFGWTVGPGVNVGDLTGGLAVDLDTAYVGGQDATGGGRISAVDLDSGQVERVDGLADVGVGAVTDVGVDRWSEGRFTGVWAVDADGTLVEIDAESRRVVRSVETQRFQEFGASLTAVVAPTRSVLAVAPGARKVYVATGGRITAVESRRVAAARLSADAEATETDVLEVDRAIDVDGEVTGLEVSADGRTLYATVVRASAEAELIAYDARTLERVRSVSVGTNARALAISDDGNRAYVTGGRSVAVVDLQTLAVVQDIDTGSATAVAFVPGRDTILVTNPSTNSVSVISNPFNAPTVANADTATTGEDNSVVINVLANDSNAGGAVGDLSPTVVAGPANGTVTVNDEDGTLRYTPNANFHGTDTFSYTVTGGSSNAAPTSVTVTVTQAITTELSWNANPADLDAHLIGPSATEGGSGFHVYYASSTYNVDGTVGGSAERAALLVSDDTDGDGPEVIEVNTRTPGEYVYYVHKFAGEGSLAGSGAEVTVVDPSTELSRTFTVDPESAGTYWAVFKMTVSDSGTVTITELNTYGDTAPTASGSSPGGSSVTA